MGGIRFKRAGSDDFLEDNSEFAAPPMASLRELEHAAIQIEKDDNIDSDENYRLYSFCHLLHLAQDWGNILHLKMRWYYYCLLSLTPSIAGVQIIFPYRHLFLAAHQYPLTALNTLKQFGVSQCHVQLDY